VTAMFTWVFLLALDTGEVFHRTYDKKDECVARLRVAARSEGVADAWCVQVPWRKA